MVDEKSLVRSALRGYHQPSLVVCFATLSIELRVAIAMTTVPEPLSDRSTFAKILPEGSDAEHTLHYIYEC